MSDERLARIEAKLDGLSATVESLAGTVGTLAGTVATLVGGQAKLETNIAELQAGQLQLGNDMRVLYEDTLDKMKALDPAPLFAEFRREITAGQAQVILRLDLVEKSVGQLWKRQASS